MIKKLFLGSFLFGLVAVSTVGVVYASDEDAKPWENFGQFKEGFKGYADLREDMDREEFFAFRNEAREAHRAERMLQREARLNDALERGCINEEELQERLQQRKGRLSSN